MHEVLYTLALLLTIPASIVFLSSGSWAANTAFGGPFDLEIKELHQCNDHPENDEIYLGSYKIGRASRTSLQYTGSFNTKSYLNDSYDVKLTAAIWGNGGWRENYYNINLGGFCGSLKKYLSGFFEKMKENNNELDCPMKAGSYIFTNVSLDVLQLESLPAMQYAKYKVEYSIWKKKSRAFCCIVMVDLVPKSKQKTKGNS